MMLTLGVVADTHVPDRARLLNPKVTDIFREAGVVAILHAGDICSPEILDQLGGIALVHAVQGNRDIWRLAHLPPQISLQFEGVNIGLTHGQAESVWNAEQAGTKETFSETFEVRGVVKHSGASLCLLSKLPNNPTCLRQLAES